MREKSAIQVAALSPSNGPAGKRETRSWKPQVSFQKAGTGKRNQVPEEEEEGKGGARRPEGKPAASFSTIFVYSFIQSLSKYLGSGGSGPVLSEALMSPW